MTANKPRAVSLLSRPLLAIAVGSLLGFAPPTPAQAQYYTYSGSVYTYPTDLIPIFDPFESLFDLTGYGMVVGSSAPGSFSALTGAWLKVDNIRIGDGGTGDGAFTATGAGTKVELGGTGNRLEVGNWGTGTMVVSAGALVDASVNAAACGAPGTWCNSFIGNGAGSTGTLTVNGNGSEVRAMRNFIVGGTYVDVGFGTPGGTTRGYLNVLDGGTLRTESAYLAIGPNGPGALGTESSFTEVAIDGAGSRWFITANSIDGVGARLSAANHANTQATFTIDNGGQMIVDGSAGPGPYDTVELGSNGGRADLTVSGGGKLLLSGGAAPDRTADLVVGGYRSGSSQATVTGTDSEIVVTGAHAFLTVGSTGGTGRLDVLSGGRATSGGLYIAARESVGAVNVTGGAIDLNGSDGRLLVGISGSGTFVVSDGGVVDATLNPGVCGGNWCGSAVANGAGSTGVLTVTGAGSEVRTLRGFTAGSAYVDAYTGTAGSNSTATINILNGGTLRTEGTRLSIGPSGPDALGSEWTFADVLINGAGSQWIVTRNTVDNDTAYLVAGTHANSQATINITNRGKLIIDGTGSVGPYDGMNLATNGGRADLTVSGIGSAVEVTGANAFIGVGRSGATGQASFNVLAGASASAMLFNVGREGAHGTLTIDGAGSQMTLSGVGTPGIDGPAFAAIGRDGGTGNVVVSSGGRWLITDGGADSRPSGYGPGINIGSGVGSTGKLEISGPGSTVEIVSTSLGLPPGVADNFNPYMSVGRDSGSSGELTISDGGKLLMTGNALSTLSDSRSTTLNIGGYSDSVAGGNGAALVTGAGSEIRLSGIDTFIGVGRAGSTGHLSVADHALVAAIGMNVGRVGVGTLSVDNASLEFSGQQTGSFLSGAFLSIGSRGGAGVATLSNGSLVTLTNLGTSGASLNLGGTSPNPLGNGTLDMSGGSQINVVAASGLAVVSVGRDGTGVATLDGASSIDVGDGSIYLGRLATGKGTMTLRGGSLLTAGYVGIGSTPGVDTGTGTLIVNNSTVTATTIEIGALGTLGGNEGTINGTLINRGTLAPGESPGRIVINGGIINQDDGRLLLDVQADGHGNFLTDALILTLGSTYDFGEMKVIFNFIGDTDPNLFMATGEFDMDTFLLSRDGSVDSGLSSVFAPGTDWGDLFTSSQFSAQSDSYSVTELTFNANGSFDIVAVPVPEPSNWALALLGLAVLGLRRRFAGGVGGVRRPTRGRLIVG